MIYYIHIQRVLAHVSAVNQGNQVCNVYPSIPSTNLMLKSPNPEIMELLVLVMPPTSEGGQSGLNRVTVI